jgi:protein-disulfide isomerase
MKSLPQAVIAAAIIAVAIVAGAVIIRPADTPRIDAGDREVIGAIVRDYLVENPDVMRDVFAALEQSERESQQARREQVLADAHDFLFQGDDVILGNPDGDVTLVEFFDYNCGYCARALEDVERMIEADPDLRVVLKDFPVLGEASVEASQIGVAAMQQFDNETLAEFHTRLMRVRGRANGERALDIARDLGADTERLMQDAESEDVIDILRQNYATASDLGVSGTPAWVIGDRVISGAVGVERLGTAVANMRACGSVEC